MTHQKLKKKYPVFIYEKYSWKISRRNLEIFFNFKIPPDIIFNPKIIINNIKKSQIKKLEKSVFENLIFHLGLAEIPSYWKATCSPKIEIRAGYLNKEQINFWKNLILKGMGQFFYENKIDFTKPNFIKIVSKSKAYKKSKIINFLYKLQNRFLVPIGGGKDSIVTLEKLKEQKKEINGFVVNPSKFTKDVLRVAGIKKPIVVARKIDPTLLKLNQKGYLNGHTPFTSVLSFLSVFCAVLFSYKNIAFSNEKSSDEGNVNYCGVKINHQYSKSSEFEKKFRDYCQKYLVKGVNYFSFLRPYKELEISKMFTKYPQYFSVFSSCNQVLAKKLKKRWCGNCPKCLFIYASLYPFLQKNQLQEIFNEDFFEKKELLPIMKSLIGQGSHKPFECVGTLRESRLAFSLSFKKAQKNNKIPYLLTKVK